MLQATLADDIIGTDALRVKVISLGVIGLNTRAVSMFLPRFV